MPEDVDVYGVSTSTNEERPNHPPSAWLDKEGWEYPTLADSPESQTATAFGLSGFPFFVALRSEEHTSELQSLIRISYAVFCLKKKKENKKSTITNDLHL